MQYRKNERNQTELSALGFGCMRLPGGYGRIDMAKSEALIASAFERGVNYYDTAYLYPGNEEALGEILEKLGIREKVYIATKLPHASCKSTADIDRYFDTEKKRLRTDYIDYYLMHNMTSYKQWEALLELGIIEWIQKKKASGEIRQIGFSFHGPQMAFPKILDAYDWDFVQIQYNYVNINYQAGKYGLELAAQKGLPVIIMEPLLGGKLANGLPEKAQKLFHESNPNSTPAEWALRWLWHQPQVTVILSGMNSMAQLDENIKIASKTASGSMSEAELKTVDDALNIFNESYKIPCTGCNYCMPCPKNINIPASFAAYNTSYAVDWKTGIMQYVLSANGMNADSHFASDCIKCGKCEGHCPQHIQIRKELDAVKKRFEVPGLKLGLSVVRKFFR